MVYETDIDSEDHPIARIVSEAAEIRETSGVTKYGTSMHSLSGCQWTCVPALVQMGQKTGSILCQCNTGVRVYLFFFFLFLFLERSTFSFCLAQNDLFAHTYFHPSLPLRPS